VSLYRPVRPRASAMQDLTREEVMVRTQRLGVEPAESDAYVMGAFLQFADALESGHRVVIDDGSETRELLFRPCWRPGQPPLIALDVPAGERPTRPFRLAVSVSRGGTEPRGA
jgi:hypothetical protein